MIIEVTQADIDQAQEQRSIPGYIWTECCPIALAFRRSGYPSAAVGLTVMDIDGRHILSLPDEARQFIANVDNHQPTAPFSFEVDYMPGETP